MGRSSNPYIGPRSFRTGEALYGRDHETNELLDLLIAERIVLLNSPSGAGKSSLLNAGLLPRLRKEGFAVSRPLRVSLQLPPEVPLPEGSNRFVVSLLLSMEEALPEGVPRLPLHELLTMELSTYLDRGDSTAAHESSAMLIDQFEEILTFEPNNRAAKTQFFEQMARVLRDKNRWALFAMREEFVAALEPYARLLPTRLAARYRLDLLRPDQALDSITRPASAAGVPVDSDAAAELVRNLSLIKVQQPDGSTVEEPGMTIEPVQLQVVMRRLWDTLPRDASSISVEQVRQVGEVDRALAEYYRDLVSAAAFAGRVSERVVRDWIARELITEQGFRNQIPQQPERTRGLDNCAIDPLVDGYLIRADKRRGLAWYELAHDRLVGPIQSDNTGWLEQHLSPLQRQAALWLNQNRPDGLLLRGDALAGAEQWAAANVDQLEPVEKEFLEDCVEQRHGEEHEHRAARRLRRLAIAASVGGVLSLILAVFALRTVYDLVDVARQLRSAMGDAFAWSEPTFNPDEWRAALDANSAMNEAFSRVDREQLKGITVILGPIHGDPERVALVSNVLRRLGFGNVIDPPPAAVAQDKRRGFTSGLRADVAAVLEAYGVLRRARQPVNAMDRPRLSVTYPAGIDPDIVRIVVFLLLRARADIVEIKPHPDPAGAIHIDRSSNVDAHPYSVADTNKLLPAVEPHPWFSQMLLSDHKIADAIGDPTGQAQQPRVSFQAFEHGSMLWIDYEVKVHYQWKPAQNPAPDKVRLCADEATQEQVTRLLETPDPRVKLFQPDGGFLRVWLNCGLEKTFGWPLAVTKFTEPAPDGNQFQRFDHGIMVAPLPVFDVFTGTYLPLREHGNVVVLVVLDDNRYFIRSVKDSTAQP